MIVRVPGSEPRRLRRATSRRVVRGRRRAVRPLPPLLSRRAGRRPGRRSGPSDVLDVGCGTGKAGAAARRARAAVLGVEIDPRDGSRRARRTVSRSRSVRSRTGNLIGRRFDLLDVRAGVALGGPAIVRCPRPPRVLRPGGTLALFWNRSSARAATSQDELEGCTATVLRSCSARRRAAAREPPYAGDLERSGLFEKPFSRAVRVAGDVHDARSGCSSCRRTATT